MAKKKADLESQYKGKTLPSLYLIATQRSIKNFFPKNEEEMIALLEEWDLNHNTSEEGVDSMAKEEILEDDDILDDMDDELEEESDKANTNRTDGMVPESEQEEEEPEELDEEEELEDDDIEELDDSEDLNDDIPEESEKPKKNKKDKKGFSGEKYIKNLKKIADEYSIELESSDAESIAKEILEYEIEKADVKAVETILKSIQEEGEKEEMATKKKTSKKSEKKGTAHKPNSSGTSPYSETSAGHFVFMALKKGGTIETVCKAADAEIKKNKIKPPSNTEQKVKIIMGEINKGKKGNKWGSFVKNEKTGKITHKS